MRLHILVHVLLQLRRDGGAGRDEILADLRGRVELTRGESVILSKIIIIFGEGIDYEIMCFQIYEGYTCPHKQCSHLFLDRLAKRHHEIGFHVLKDARDDRFGKGFERVEERRLQVGRVASGTVKDRTSKR